VIRKIAVAAFLAYAAFIATLALSQTSLLFPAVPFENRPAPPGASIVLIPTPDGEMLRAIHWPAPRGAGTVVVLHGNGSSAEREVGRGVVLREAGHGVLLAEYRGYGGSTGTASANGLKTDVLATIDWLKERSDVLPVLYAHSLGTGLAIHAAARRPVSALVLEAAYTSISDIASYHYPVVPVRWLLRHDIRPIDEIGVVLAPMLMIHGGRDTLIPVLLGERLRDAAQSGGVEWILLPEAGHNDLAVNGAMEHLLAFLATVPGFVPRPPD
jgi:hypothetical protein